VATPGSQTATMGTGRFLRARSTGREWVGQLYDPFTLDDLVAAAAPSETHAALSWLYDAIERGRVVPLQLEGGLTYHFTGDRRAGDRNAGSGDAVPAT
jgi:hypothetical protein